MSKTALIIIPTLFVLGGCVPTVYVDYSSLTKSTLMNDVGISDLEEGIVLQRTAMRRDDRELASRVNKVLEKLGSGNKLSEAAESYLKHDQFDCDARLCSRVFAIDSKFSIQPSIVLNSSNIYTSIHLNIFQSKSPEGFTEVVVSQTNK